MKRIFVFALLLCLLALPALADAPQLSFNRTSGFSPDPFTLTMSCDDPRATIYYTLDGSVPDETSLVYEGGLRLEDSSTRADVLMRITGTNSAENYIPEKDFPSAHVVRAVAVNRRGERSPVVSGTYFVGYDREKLYGDTAIVCLVTDADNLFDPATGIYVLGDIFDAWARQQTEPFEDWEAQGNFTQRGRAWERPVSVTFLPAEGDGFTQDMGMRIKGGASRGYHQKSIRLIAREEYGDKNVNYPIYPDNFRESDGELVDKYKSFTLRSGANDSLFAKIRDPFITNLSFGLRFDTAQNMPVIAFINGEYWGVYTLNEEYTDKYIQYHYGIDDNNVIMVKVGELDEGEEGDLDLFGEMFEFVAWEDLEDPAVYAKACGMLDMEGFADYCAMQFFIVNEDGPFENNNWQFWRAREVQTDVSPYADGKWRVMLYDTDYSSGVYSNGDGADLDVISPALNKEVEEDWHPVLLFQNLMLSEEFRRTFIASCCDVNNLYFSRSRAEKMLQDMSAQYQPYVPDSLRRFGPQWVTWNAENHYKNNLNSLKRFFQKRPSEFLSTVRDALDLGEPVTINVKIKDRNKGQVFINGRDVPVLNNARLTVFQEAGLTIIAVPNEGAVFTGWTVSHDSAVVADPSAPTTTVTPSPPILNTGGRP